MTNRAPTLRRAGFLAGVVLFASGSLAFAQAPNDLPEAVADALVYVLGYDPTLAATYESTTGDAYLVTITNLLVVGSAPNWSLLLPAVTVEGPRLRNEGGFTADRINFNGAIIKVEDEVIGGWATGYSEPAIVGTPEEVLDILSEPWRYPDRSMARVEEISFMGATADYIEGAGTWTEGVYEMAGFNLPLDALGDNASIQALSALGLTAIAADLTVAVSFDIAGQWLSFDKAALSVASIGDFDLSLAMSGYDLLGGAFALESPAPSIGKNPKGDGLASGATTPMPDPLLDYFHLTFTDRGLLALPGIGVAVESRLTEIVGWLDDAALNEGLAAIDGLLGKRRTIAISATPVEPVRFSEIGEAGESDPAEMAELLDLRVTSGN